MSQRFLHGVDDIIAKMLWANRPDPSGAQSKICSDPTPWASYFRGTGTAPSTAWPAFAGSEPVEPDNCVTVYETTPQYDAKDMLTGHIAQHYGITVRVRGRTKALARQKAEDIRWDFNEKAWDQQVTLDSQQYLIQSVPWTQLIGPLREVADSQRWYCNVNCFAVVLAYPITG